MVKKGSEYGQMLVFFALSLPVIIVIVLLVSSIGMVFIAKNELQSAVDAAALAAIRSSFAGMSPEKTADSYLKENVHHPYKLEISIEDAELGAIVSEKVAKDLSFARQVLEKEKNRAIVFHIFAENVEDQAKNVSNTKQATEQEGTLIANNDFSRIALEDYERVRTLLAEREIEKENALNKEAQKSLSSLDSTDNHENVKKLRAKKITLKVSADVELLLQRFISFKDLSPIHIEATADAVLAPEILAGEIKKEKVPYLGTFLPLAAPFALTLEDINTLDFREGVTKDLTLELGKVADGIGLLPIVYQKETAEKLLQRVNIEEKIDPSGAVKSLPALPYEKIFSFTPKIAEGGRELFFAGFFAQRDEKNFPLEEEDLILDTIVPEEMMQYRGKDFGIDSSSYQKLLSEKDDAPYAGRNLPNIKEYIFHALEKKIARSPIDTKDTHIVDERLILVPLLKLKTKDFFMLQTGEDLFTEDKIFRYDLDGNPLATYVSFYLQDVIFNREEDRLFLKGFFVRTAVPNGTNAYFAATHKHPAKLTDRFVEQKIFGSEFYMKLKVRLLGS